MTERDLVGKILIHHDACSEFYGYIMRTGDLDRSIQVSTDRHPCFPYKIVSVRSRDMSFLIRTMQTVREINRTRCNHSGCVVLLSLDAADRLYASFKRWSSHHHVTITCMRRVDIVNSLPERWLTIGGNSMDVDRCLEEIIRNTLPFLQMTYQLDYSLYTPLSEVEMKQQMKRAQLKSWEPGRPPAGRKSSGEGRFPSVRRCSGGKQKFSNQKQPGRYFKPTETLQTSEKQDLLDSLTENKSMFPKSCDQSSRGSSCEVEHPLPRRPRKSTSEIQQKSGAVALKAMRCDVELCGSEQSSFSPPLPKLIPISQLKIS